MAPAVDAHHVQGSVLVPATLMIGVTYISTPHAPTRTQVVLIPDFGLTAPRPLAPHQVRPLHLVHPDPAVVRWVNKRFGCVLKSKWTSHPDSF